MGNFQQSLHLQIFIVLKFHSFQKRSIRVYILICMQTITTNFKSNTQV